VVSDGRQLMLVKLQMATGNQSAIETDNCQPAQQLTTATDN
jgi:hypothetical protein